MSKSIDIYTPLPVDAMQIDENPLLSLLPTNDDSRVKDKEIQLDNPATSYQEKLKLKEKRKAQRSSKKKKKMSSKDRKLVKLHEIPQNACDFDLFQPLHQLWQGYIRELLGRPIEKPKDSDGVSKDWMYRMLPQVGKLIKADYHGAKITVYKSKCSSLVGLTGIVVKETENTFVIISRKVEEGKPPVDKFKTIPKMASIFLVHLPEEYQCSAEVYGSQIAVGAAQRITKKYRTQQATNVHLDLELSK